MRISILLPHYKTWKMSFYTIHQLLKCRGRHQIDIWVIDNNPADGTAKNLEYYGDKIQVVPYPAHLLQSHGIGYDSLIPLLRTEVFATIESDSFPTDESGAWLDWIDLLLKDGYDSAGSCLQLSGGQFVHTAGAFYKKSIWQKAKRYVDNIEYTYYPNIAMKDGFPCHLMVHNSVKQQFIEDPANLINLSEDYLKDGRSGVPYWLGFKWREYLPVGRGVFHNGIGNRDESYFTYAQRNVNVRIEDDGERHHILLDNKKPLIWRMGMEPGQWLCYWLLANKYNIFNIPTEVKWLPGRENQQQEYTKMENGFTHLWAVTAYSDVSDPGLKDIIDFKKNQMEELYNSIPANQRI